MNVKVFHIVIAEAIKEKFNLAADELTHPNEQEAIDTLKEAFKGIKYSIKTDGSETKFLNEFGGVLATVVCE